MMQENLLKEYGLYINGEWRPASDGATFSSTDPATGEHLAVCAEATKVDVDNAVKAAQKAFETWKDTTAQQRAEILNKIADIIDANAVHLAKVESMDNGKPFRETSGIDIPMSADHFRYFAAAIRTQEVTAKSAGLLTTLGVAYAEAGLYDKAEDAFRRAAEAGSETARHNLEEVRQVIDQL